MAGRKSDFTLTKLDDLFTTQAQRDEEQLSKIRDIPLELIDDFPDHPFKVRDDEDMMQLVESVKERGVITPATVRQKEDGRYELVSGHRRKRACELAGFETLRSEIVDLNRDEATILMVESNFQRSEILPSEKAFAYKMRLEAMKRQAGRPRKENVSPVGTNLRTDEQIAQETGDSRNQIHRYVRLTNLVPELLEFVDEGRIKMRPAVELSYLDEDCQRDVVDEIDLNDATPSHDQTTNTVQRSVKTAEQTAKTSIKTTKEAAVIAQKTAKTTAKATQKAAQAAQKAAKATADTVKATAKATVAAVKAIIAGTKALVAAIAAGGWIAVLIIMIVVLFGAAVAMFGGGSDSNSYTPVSAEVEAYEPIIQKYAKEYGISEYVELIKAVMMQESGGRGLDPMQAAEGSFNTKYPHEPNGIKDPEYSIQCGVQELKAALTSAEVESPIDMEHIKLALQGYNFGNGYISWAKTNYGGYSYANAVEFSTMQASRLGWSSYGDTQYVAHVLRYYPYGRAFTAGGNQAIVEVALTQLGNQGGQPYWSWYGFNSRVEWCACFVSWCADQCGYIESGLVPKFAGCVDGANWFKSNGKWQDRTYEPKVGDIIFFDWEGDGTTDHVGIVEKCENGTVYTVEGNSGDACKQRQYAVGSSNIYGYGIPAY